MQNHRGGLIASLCLASLAALSGCGSQGDEQAAGVSSAPEQSQSSSAAVSGTSSSSPTSADEGDDGSAGTCAPHSTSLLLEREQGAAGSSYYSLIVTNSSSDPCQVGGFPGLSAVDSSGAQLGAAATRENVSWEVITLQPGQSATTTLQVVNPDNVCPNNSAQAAHIRVYLPEQRDSVDIGTDISVCQGQEANMTISPFIAH